MDGLPKSLGAIPQETTLKLMALGSLTFTNPKLQSLHLHDYDYDLTIRSIESRGVTESVVRLYVVTPTIDQQIGWQDRLSDFTCTNVINILEYFNLFLHFIALR